MKSADSCIHVYIGWRADTVPFFDNLSESNIELENGLHYVAACDTCNNAIQKPASAIFGMSDFAVGIVNR